MKINWRAIGFGILTTAGLILAGLLAGYATIHFLRDEKFARWVNLGKPGEGADHFVYFLQNYTDRTVDVSVATKSGIVYVRNAQKREDWQVYTPLEMQQWDCMKGYENLYQDAFSRFGGEIKNCAQIMWSWEYTGDYDVFVILNDGSVWKWRNYHPLTDILILFCYFPLGFLLIGWILVLFIRRTNRVKKGG